MLRGVSIILMTCLVSISARSDTRADCEQQNDFRRKEAACAALIEAGTDLAPSHFRRAYARAELGDHRGALDDWNKVIALSPQSHAAFNNRGNALGQLGQHLEALASFAKAIQLKPGYGPAYAGRGNAMRQLGKLDAALADFTKAIELKPPVPNLAHAYRMRGVTWRMKGELDRALSDLDEAVRLQPQKGENYYQRGLVHLDRNTFDDALKEINQSMTVERATPQRLSKRGETYNRRGRARNDKTDHDRAIEDFTLLIEQYKSIHAYCQRATAYNDKGDIERAKADLDKAVVEARRAGRKDDPCQQAVS
jgi:tetratricopeptide (TPR) repeat protein